MNSDLHCLHIVLTCVSTLLILFFCSLSPQVLEVQANELSLWLWRIAIFSLLFANSLFSCISRRGVILNIFLSSLKHASAEGQAQSMARAESRCLDSVEFLPPFPWLSHLRDWKSNEGSYSVLTLSDVCRAPHPLSKGTCTHFVKRGWDPSVSTSRNTACAKLKEKQ